MKEPLERAEEQRKGTTNSQVRYAGRLHISQSCSVGSEGRGAVDQRAVLSQALAEHKAPVTATNPSLQPLPQGVKAVLQTPRGDLLSLPLAVHTHNFVACSFTKPSICREEALEFVFSPPVAALALRQLSGSPAALQAASTEYLGYVTISTIPPPWHVPELLKPTQLFHTATTVSFFPPKKRARAAPHL